MHRCYHSRRSLSAVLPGKANFLSNTQGFSCLVAHKRLPSKQVEELTMDHCKTRSLPIWTICTTNQMRCEQILPLVVKAVAKSHLATAAASKKRTRGFGENPCRFSFLGRFTTPTSIEKIPLFHAAFPGLTRNIVEHSRYVLLTAWCPCSRSSAQLVFVQEIRITYVNRVVMRFQAPLAI